AAPPGAERHKQGGAKIAPPLPDAEMKFGKRAGVSVVLDENRQIRKLVRQSLFQPDPAPAGQMRRIDKDAFGDLQRPADRNADRERLAARSSRGFNRLLYQTGDSRKCLVERARGFGRDLFAPQNLGLRGAFNDRRLRSPDIQTDDRLTHKIGPIAVARFAGLRDKSLSYLGFRAAALHPRLYSVARIRGLRTRQYVGKD